MSDIVLRDVTKIFGDDVLAVDEVSLSIEDEELVVFVGPSGSGKSTTLRMIAGLEKPTEGQILIDDEDVMKVNNSLFREGDTYQFMDIPDVPYRGSISRYDAVLKDGENVGISKHPSYNYNEREVASLGWIDDEYAEPGTRVTIMWGDRDTEKTQIEPHVQTDLQATVAPAPYMKTDRQDM